VPRTTGMVKGFGCRPVVAVRAGSEGRRPKPFTEADLASGRLGRNRSSPNTSKRFCVRSEPAPYGGLHRSLWESTCGSIIEVAATSGSG
jgi:hypothetical protein